MEKAAKAARALAAMLDRFYAMMMAIVIGLLGLVGIRPKWTGGGLARVVAEEMATVTEEPRSELGEAVKQRALQLRGMAPSAVLVPLPEPIETWLGTLSPSDLQTVTGLPAATLEQHVTAGENGALKSLGFVRSTAPAVARPAVDWISGGSAAKASKAVAGGIGMEVEALLAAYAPQRAIRPR